MTGGSYSVGVGKNVKGGEELDDLMRNVSLSIGTHMRASKHGLGFAAAGGNTAGEGGAAGGRGSLGGGLRAGGDAWDSDSELSGLSAFASNISSRWSSPMKL